MYTRNSIEDNIECVNKGWGEVYGDYVQLKYRCLTLDNNTMMVLADSPLIFCISVDILVFVEIPTF